MNDRKREIREWECMAVIDERTLHEKNARYAITIDRPIFANGSEGRPGASITITMKSRYLRIPLPVFQELFEEAFYPEFDKSIEYALSEEKRLNQEYDRKAAEIRARRTRQHRPLTGASHA